MSELAPTLLDLLEPPPIIEVDPRGLSLDERFERFVEKNEWVIDRLAQMALYWKRRGRKHYGIKSLCEKFRWDYLDAVADPTCDWKINNSYTSRLARLLMERHPELDGFFETRELRS